MTWGGLVRRYKNQSGNLTLVETLVDEEPIGPGISDGYIIIENTTTITRTVTLPGGETTVVTEVRTVTVPERGPDRRVVLAGLGALAALLLLLARH